MGIEGITKLGGYGACICKHEGISISAKQVLGCLDYSVRGGGGEFAFFFVKLYDCLVQSLMHNIENGVAHKAYSTPG